MAFGATQPTERSASSYRHVCRLAEGGVGTVELSVLEEGRFRRLYAVKRLREVYRDDGDFREMFLDEARIAGLLRHPNVVSVLDVGEDADGPFLVMDYVEGVAAAMLVQRASEQGTLLPLQLCVRVVMDAAEGLHAAHELRDARGRPMNLVHRDVSPQNLLVGFDGVARVTDFGIAKALGRMTRTQTGILKGKFGYMSPEQLRFEEPDHRSDLFALGVVLFELLSGARLYRNEDGMDGARRILNEPPPDIGEHRDDVPPELVSLLFSMLAKDPSHRPGDAHDVARRLEAVLTEAIAEQGRLEVAPYVEGAFADERRAQQRRIEVAIADATARATKPQSPHDAADPATRERSGRVGWLMAGAALLLLVGGGAAWWGVRAADQDTRGAPAAGQDVSPAAPIEPADRTSAEPEGERSGERDDDAHASGEADGPEPAPQPGAAANATGEPSDARGAAPSAGAEAERDEVDERKRRRRNARRRRRQGSEGSGGVPMWDWE